MEEYSNARLEETLKVQAHEEEKKVVLEDSEASKPDVEFVRDIAADLNSESVNETPGGEDSSSNSSSSDKEEEPEQRIPEMENSETFEEEKVVSDSAVESVELDLGVSLTEEFSQDMEPSFEKPGDSDATELDAKETDKNISPALDEFNSDSPMLTDLMTTALKKQKEQLPPAETTWDSELSTDVESMGIDDGVPAAAVAQGITEAKIQVSDNNVRDSSGFPELASKENVEDSLQAANVPIFETRDAEEPVNKPDIHESTENQPILSVHRRSVQPTSWKSCCGLFEVLRRSNR